MKTNKKSPYKNANELVKQLANKEISATELLEETIARIEKEDEKINAIPVRDFVRAREAAKKADIQIAKGERKPLLGLPMTVKESFNVAGLATTWANKAFANYLPDEDALTVKRLKDAGAIIIGKSNVPFMLQDWQTYNDMYGTTNNPLNLKLTAGGSSGGSGAALAAGFVSLELGSDLAGSLRTPAHFCGVCCHKPSQDIVPMRGTAPPTMLPSPGRVDLVVSGPMARSVDDLILSLNILAGPDELSDGKGYKLELPKPSQKNLKDFRVLVLDTHPLCPTEHSIQQSLEELSNKLQKLNAKVSRDATSLDLAKITRVFAKFLGAFGTGNIPLALYNKSQAAAKKLNADDDSLPANILRGAAASHRDWLIAMQTRNDLRRDIRNVFNKFDVILCPPMPTVAFAHDHSKSITRKLNIDGELVPYENQYAWVSIASLFGLPATVIPISKTSEGLPIGVQIIGDYLGDLTTLEFARLLNSEIS